jgi:hypothetical protein
VYVLVDTCIARAISLFLREGDRLAREEIQNPVARCETKKNSHQCKVEKRKLGEQVEVRFGVYHNIVRNYVHAKCHDQNILLKSRTAIDNI